MNEEQLCKLRYRLIDLITDRRMHMEPTAERVEAFAKELPYTASCASDSLVLDGWRAYCREHTWTVCWEYCSNSGVLFAHAETAEDACAYAFQVYSGKDFKERARIRVFKGEPEYVFKGPKAY
jgi:hypothetical protein